MQRTMNLVIRGAARAVHEMKLIDFIFSHPAQVALLGIQFQWTADVQVRPAMVVPQHGTSATTTSIV